MGHYYCCVWITAEFLLTIYLNLSLYSFFTTAVFNGEINKALIGLT